MCYSYIRKEGVEIEVHERIRALRIARGLSQEELAARVGYSDRSSIAKVESGKVDLSQSKIKLFASALGVTPGDILGLTDEAPQPSITREQQKVLDLVAAINSKLSSATPAQLEKIMNVLDLLLGPQ